MMKLRLLFAKKNKQRILPIPNDERTTAKPRLVTCSYDEPSKTQSTSSASDVECPSSHPRRQPPRVTPHCQKSARSSLSASYQVISQVTGHGVTGEVRPCIHRRTNETRAVKKITKNLVRRKERIRREVEFLSEVDHPNIVKLHDVYEDQNEVHIVTELCRGGELFDAIVKRAKRGNVSDAQPPCFDEATAVSVIRSLLGAISYLHKRDIVHRDLKPENILFVNDGDDNLSIKLIDFGLSVRHEEKAPPLQDIVGTAYYMDPSLLNGSYDRSCDIWSVGVITYIMLSGRPPFNGPSDDVIFKMIRRGRYSMSSSLWTNISDEAKDFIRCLLVRERSKRCTADMALNHPWLRQR